jgi:(p)ppGpp synthase/HD superfamily hydrolase
MTKPNLTVKPTVESTIDLIKWLHQGQTDWEGEPYWQHPIAVMKLLDDPRYGMDVLGPPTEAEIFMSLLHDTEEDVFLDRETGEPVPETHPRARRLTPDDLRGYGYDDATVVTKIDHYLTRHPDTNILETTKKEFRNGSHTYLDKIRLIRASGDRSIMRVKLADNLHNSDPERRKALSPDRLQAAISIYKKRYKPSIAILREGLGLPQLEVFG